MAKKNRERRDTDPLAPLEIDRDLHPVIRRLCRAERLTPTRVVNRLVLQQLRLMGLVPPDELAAARPG